jgi:uracil-DNA glycosylase
MSESAAGIEPLLAEIRQCRLCATALPLGPRPVVRASTTAKLLIIGQAPGTRVHESGIPWDDRSGDQLREWLAMDPLAFYDESRVGIMPMGFCYPGVDANGGDKPPRRECAPAWHNPLMAHMGAVELVLLVGMYAQRQYLGKDRKRNLTTTVAAWRDYAPRYIPLPHPSWRNLGWRKKNPWFEADVIPMLRNRVAPLMG